MDRIRWNQYDWLLILNPSPIRSLALVSGHFTETTTKKNLSQNDFTQNDFIQSAFTQNSQTKRFLIRR